MIFSKAKILLTCKDKYIEVGSRYKGNIPPFIKRKMIRYYRLRGCTFKQFGRYYYLPTNIRNVFYNYIK